MLQARKTKDDIVYEAHREAHGRNESPVRGKTPTSVLTSRLIRKAATFALTDDPNSPF